MFQDLGGLSVCNLGRFWHMITLYPMRGTGVGLGD
jgi:hypothetical protein